MQEQISHRVNKLTEGHSKIKETTDNLILYGKDPVVRGLGY